MLKDRGIDVIFGIPGVHNQEMYRGIEEAGISHVLARHEQGAGFMADGYARATGLPGVAYVITGPGVCNIMTPMGQAYSDSVPVLVLSSCLDETAARRGQLHQMKDQEIAAGTVCDWSETAHSAEAAYSLIDRALGEFDVNRPRSKHIQVPIAQLEASAPPPPPPFPAANGVPFGDTATGNAREWVGMLSKARRPIFIFGGGAVGAAAPARMLMKRTGAAAFTTYAGRGILPADEPLNFGSYLARPDSVSILKKADLILAVGTELAEVDLWRAHLGHNCPMIRVDIDPAVLRDQQRADFQVAAGANSFLTCFLEAMPEDMSHDWTAAEISTARTKWRAEVEAEYAPIPQIADALRACLPEDAMIYSDMTQFAYCAKEIWDMDRPGHWHHPYGFGTLGYAMPAAIGGAIGRPGKPTMAIMGDYGFHYTMQELGVAVELGLSIPIILWDNGKLGAIEASMVGAQIAPNAVIARNPDFLKLAEAFGAHAVAPRTLADMQDAVRAAFDADGPTLIYLTPDITM
ncbi:thiamine pyrophosphate-binding protein [Sulfitobacter sp. MF3-043]|uniref:thiamine pyrophosphate-binding protein n=1 Tax=Sulfitobacter sediminivivens TaxID=3252902 RepID=UPI0036DC7349